MAGAKIAFSDRAGGFTDTPTITHSVIGHSIQVDVVLVDENGSVADVDDVVLNLKAERADECAADQSTTVQGTCSLVIDGAMITAPGPIEILVSQDGDDEYASLSLTVQVHRPQLFLRDAEDLFELFY